VYYSPATNYACSTTAMVGTRLHWSTDFRLAWVCEKGTASHLPVPWTADAARLVN